MSSDSAPVRVALTSLGCKVNYAEMAELAGVLAASGCDVVPDDEPADVRVLNSCTVTMQADATTRQRLRRLRRADPKAHLVLTGCSVDANPRLYPPQRQGASPDAACEVDAVFDNRHKAEIAGYVIGLAAKPARAAAGAPPLRARAFLKVQDGCNHRCTYCIVWRARGESRSVPPEVVIGRARNAVAAGHGELVLCGVDLGSYGRDNGASLSELLERLLHEVGDGARIRLSSINANDVTPKLIALSAHPRLCSHWHMPLQSGSDAILRAMHRGYRRRQYQRVVQALRAADPATEFTTDVMVGFPGETDEHHEQTVSLIDDVGFLGCHVFRWSPRPGTPANELSNAVSDAVARRRSAEARRTAARTGAASRDRACGRMHEVVWDSVGIAEAHGVASTYHQLVTDEVAGLRTGSLSRVRAVAVEGESLRATLLRT